MPSVLSRLLGWLKTQSQTAVLDLPALEIFLHDETADALPTNPALGAAWQRARHPDRAACSGGLAAAAERAGAMLAADRRVVVVALDPPAEIARLAETHADRYFDIPVADADALAWCAGLADGGCRPVICVGPAAWPAACRCWPTRFFARSTP